MTALICGAIKSGSNTFHCRAEVCIPCGNASDAIQRTPAASWGERIDQLAEPVRECVRDYLRGMWMRSQVSTKHKGQSK